jgi:hypothetical protein
MAATTPHFCLMLEQAGTRMLLRRSHEGPNCLVKHGDGTSPQ